MFWPEEDCYSDVPESKVVGAPDPQSKAIAVKERGKIYMGKLVATGTKEDVQQRLNSVIIESEQKSNLEPTPAIPDTVSGSTKSSPVTGEKNGTCTSSKACYCYCMYLRCNSAF